jgi:prepilin-type N-terminal cleavage/methylation domain-containing protein
MRRATRQKGFSLIETILATSIIAAAFMSMVYVLANTTLGDRSLGNINVAVLLARETMEQTTAKDFASVVAVAQTAYGGNFSQYRYQIDVGYVDAGDLNTNVVGPTEYKRVVVTVTRTGWNGQIKLYNLKTDV